MAQALLKDKFIKELCKQYPKQDVIDEGRTVRLEVPTKDTEERAGIAFVLAKKYKGKVKTKETEVQFNGYSLVVKPHKTGGARKTTEKSPRVYYGLLGKLDLSSMDLSALSEVDSSLATSKKLPTRLKEKSDMEGISDFNRKLENVAKTSNGVNLTIGSFTVENALGVIAVVGKEPKTDYVVVSKDGKKLIPSFYISYKMGTSAKDFQNYSGISEKTSSLIWEHKETKKFFKKLELMVEHKTMEEYKAEIEDENIILHSMYGQDYGKAYGLDNVNVLAQGDVQISAIGRVSYTHLLENGKVPPKANSYHPVFGARLATGRGAKTPDGKTVIGFRIGIFPRAYRSKWLLVG